MKKIASLHFIPLAMTEVFSIVIARAQARSNLKRGRDYFTSLVMTILNRHCEERSDEAIFSNVGDCFTSFAMKMTEVIAKESQKVETEAVSNNEKDYFTSFHFARNDEMFSIVIARAQARSNLKRERDYFTSLIMTILNCHCEERSDEAISRKRKRLLRFARNDKLFGFVIVKEPPKAVIEAIKH
jgi:hypothetical protein